MTNYEIIAGDILLKIWKYDVFFILEVRNDMITFH